jgi:hypothetical protein
VGADAVELGWRLWGGRYAMAAGEEVLERAGGEGETEVGGIRRTLGRFGFIGKKKFSFAVHLILMNLLHSCNCT